MAEESNTSRYVKLTKDHDAPMEEIRPGELNQPVHVPQNPLEPGGRAWQDGKWMIWIMNSDMPGIEFTPENRIGIDD
ncbi:hypothetical protein ACLOJK_033295 [Asimina triloba]